MIRIAAAGVTLAVTVMVGPGCARTGDASATARLQPVVLPDLSAMAPSVQRQLQAQHAALMTRATAAPSAPADLAVAHGELGKLLMAAQLDDVAVVCFTNAQALAPSDRRWPYYLAHLARRAGDLDRARPLFERAVGLAPDDVAAHVWLGDVLLGLGRPDEARPHFERALARQPSSLSARFGLGRVALAIGQDREAVTRFEDVLSRDAEAAAVHYPLSQAYRRLGEAAKADEHLRLRREHEILPADPLLVELDALLDSPQTYETLGIRALNAERWDEAAAAFRKGLALAPGNAALHQRLGTALRMQGDHAAAEREFEAAVAADAAYFPAQYSLGVLHQAAGRHAEAIARFSAALAARPTYSEARVRLGESLRRIGRAGEAVAAYDEALAADATLVDAGFGRAMALVQARRYREARTALADLHAAHPDRPDVTHALARLLAAAPDAGARDGGTALELAQSLVAGGRSIELGETLAMALAEVGEPARAVAVQRDLVTAAERAGLTAILPRLRRNLASYQRGEACRVPWPDGEVP
jgi:tetratricopeptide (TPR) repeat protein